MQEGDRDGCPYFYDELTVEADNAESSWALENEEDSSVIGIVIGAVVGFIALTILIYCIVKKCDKCFNDDDKKKDKKKSESQGSSK